MTSSILKHEKAIKLLELIMQVDRRLITLKEDLNTYNNTPDYMATIRLFNTQWDFESKIELYENVRIRLEKYYKNTVEQILPCTKTYNSLTD